MKNQKAHQQNQTNSNVKVMIGLTAIISILTFCGCQETSTTTRHQATSIQNHSSSSDKIQTLAVFPDTDMATLTDRQDMYIVGTQSYADKLMSIYEDSDIPALTVNPSRSEHENRDCVPILMVTF